MVCCAAIDSFSASCVMTSLVQDSSCWLLNVYEFPPPPYNLRRSINPSISICFLRRSLSSYSTVALRPWYSNSLTNNLPGPVGLAAESVAALLSFLFWRNAAALLRPSPPLSLDTSYTPNQLKMVFLYSQNLRLHSSSRLRRMRSLLERSYSNFLIESVYYLFSRW